MSAVTNHHVFSKTFYFASLIYWEYRCHGPGVVAGSRPMQTSNIMVKKDTRRTAPIFRPVMFLVALGAVLVAPHIGWCVIVDVRVASPSQ